MKAQNCFLKYRYVAILAILFLTFQYFYIYREPDFESLSQSQPRLNETGLDYLIVPNIVHLVIFDVFYLDFLYYLHIKSIIINQRPERILIHTNVRQFLDKYWALLRTEDCVEMSFMEKPVYVFDQKLETLEQAQQIAQLEVLIKHGGIYLDREILVIKGLDKYRKYEFMTQWSQELEFNNKVIIAHKNARFLHLWYNSYKHTQVPATIVKPEQLQSRQLYTSHPELVHSVHISYDRRTVGRLLYNSKLKDTLWKKLSHIYMASGARWFLPNEVIKEFNENNIKTYIPTFGSIARWILYGSSNVIYNPKYGMSNGNIYLSYN